MFFSREKELETLNKAYSENIFQIPLKLENLKKLISL